MRFLKYFALSTVAALCFALLPSHQAQAQVSFGVNIGAPPVCPYGYYDFPPYNCAPYGYYGPEWFNDGIFIGAGPWFHGPHGFYGHVNNHLNPHYGYHGAYPARGGHAAFHGYRGGEFHGNAMADGHGHYR